MRDTIQLLRPSRYQYVLTVSFCRFVLLAQFDVLLHLNQDFGKASL